MFPRLLIGLLLLTFAHAQLHYRLKYSKVEKPTYKYETKYYETDLDHFSFTNEEKFKLKYLISFEYWKEGSPILFYTGNEGSIEVFAENSGFIWSTALQLRALVIFAEHRYYGSSMPFKAESFKDVEHFGYLTAEQALADYACLLNDIKSNFSHYGDVPVIAFGGSYGGMLAAWFRQKYPNIVAGAIASSAPVFAFPNLTDCGSFSRIATSAFSYFGGSSCTANVDRAWKSISNIAQTTRGLSKLTALFRTCSPITEANSFIDFFYDYLGTIAMVNYPYEANFLGLLPPWPVKYFCHSLSNYTEKDTDEEVVQKVSIALNSLTNYSKSITCLDFNNSTPGLDAQGWSYQTCMEMTIPMCSDGFSDMFPPSTWDTNKYIDLCQKTYGVTPRTDWAKIQFWSKELRTLTNVVFSNGGLDPWSGMGVLNQELAPGCTIIYMPNAAHHLDLRPSNYADPIDVRRARKIELSLIKMWVLEWNKAHIV